MESESDNSKRPVDDAADGSDAVDWDATETQGGLPFSILVPERIGQYHIKRVLGTGGMGTVYEAEQDQPQRMVAVKVLQQGIASLAALRRFETESQILAHLRHPGIAQVHEAGIHGAVPFFAMELIPDAKTLTCYADEHQLGLRARLALFVQVCEAVQHGHQKGVIHRDLKPSNILVDPEGRTKIIDFGVARFTDSDMAVTTMQTAVGEIIGTLQYMSPEQCGGDPLKIDTRCDVYGLGMVLYELVSGELPYVVQNTTIYEATRMIRESAPTPLGTVDRHLRGDLETITGKALEKEPDRRYRSVDALCEDIHLYLDGRPILARAPSIMYRTSKFTIRRRWPLAGAAVLLAAVSVAGYFQIKAGGAAKSAARQTAQRLFFEAQLESHRNPDQAVEKYEAAIDAAPDFVEAKIQRAFLLRRMNRADDAIAAAKAIIEEFPDQAGPAHLVLGQLYRDRDQDAERFHLAEGARLMPEDKYYRALALGEDDAEQAVQLLTEVIDADVLNFGALWARAWRRADLQDWPGMLADSERLTARWPESSNYWNTKGVALARLSRYGEAIQAYDAALQRRPTGSGILLNRAETYQKLAMTLDEGEEQARALTDAIADCDKALEIDANFALAYALRADVAMLSSDFGSALRDAQQAIKLDPNVSLALRTIAKLHLMRGEFDEALEAYNKGIQEDGARGKDFHNRARLRRIRGEYESALADHERAVAKRPQYGFGYAARGITRRLAGDLDGAIEDLAKAVSLDPPGWGLQGNLMIWEIGMLSGRQQDRATAAEALKAAEAVGALEARQGYPFSPQFVAVCAGGLTADQVLPEAPDDLHRGIFLYYLGIRARIDGRLCEAATWFKRSRDLKLYDQFFFEMAQWHLDQLARLNRIAPGSSYGAFASRHVFFLSPGCGDAQSQDQPAHNDDHTLRGVSSESTVFDAIKPELPTGTPPSVIVMVSTVISSASGAKPIVATRGVA
ncbi:MAG: protein kinase [Planctomycetes bacterium]|nr:protein kinase [Planctomycetota bacterium]